MAFGNSTPANRPTLTDGAAASPGDRSAAGRQSGDHGVGDHAVSGKPDRNPDVRGREMDFIAATRDRERDVKAFLRAQHHSDMVRRLRLVLPIAGIGILVLVFGAYLWSQWGLENLSIGATVLENGRMVMKNPELNGVDSNQRPYHLTAREAIQNPATPRQIEMVEINANVPMEDGDFAKILAGTGFFDADAKTLQLGGEVDVTTERGMVIRMQDADVNIKSGNLVTENPVSVRTEQAEISAKSLKVEDNGARIVFENRVRMVIYPGAFGNGDNEAAGE